MEVTSLTRILIVSAVISSCGLTPGISQLPATDTAPPPLVLPAEWSPTPFQALATVIPPVQPPAIASQVSPTEDVRSARGPFVLDALQMWSPADGWGQTPNRSEDGPRVLRTLDGGTTWSDVTPLGAPQGPQVSGDVVSLNADVAWYFVAEYPLDRSRPDLLVVTVYQTLDGGGHWNAGAPIEAKSAIADMPMFIDRLHGWLLPWTGEETGREHRQLWRTTDGGRTWELLTTTEEPEGVPTGCSKNGLAFADERVGLMTGVCPGPFFLYKTSDGGATWFSHPLLPVPEGLPPDDFWLAESSSSNPVFFPGGAGYFLVLRRAPYGPSSQCLLYTTRDSGETWTPHILPYEMVYARLINPDQGWGLSGQHHEKLFVTRNGGEDWEYVGLRPDIASTLDSCHIDFADLQHAWCLGGGELFSTVDGGRTWQRLEPVLASAS